MIEEEEEIICVLEEIDNTFSSINRRLREVRGAVERMGEQSVQIAHDLDPWIRFFEADWKCEADASVCEEVCKENPQNMSEIHESPLVMKFSSPRNPFVDATSSEILNRTFLGDLDRRFQSGMHDSMSSGLVSLPMQEFELCESDSSEMHSFDADAIPAAFRSEKELFLIYEFISKSRGAGIEQIGRAFPSLSRGKIDVFVDLLLRKRFVCRRDGVFRTE